MTRVWVMTLILGLIPTVALAQDALESACEVTTELASGEELATIHSNVLCLHQRLDAIREELNRASGDESEDRSGASSGRAGRYVVLPPGDDEGGSINPCDRGESYNATLCHALILRTFGGFCTTGNCAEGFDPWRDYMPQSWNDYLNENEIYTFTPGTWVGDILREQEWFRLDESEGQMFDMQQFFRNMEPGRVLTPMPMPQLQGTGR